MHGGWRSGMAHGGHNGQLRHGGKAAGTRHSQGPDELRGSSARREMNKQEDEVQIGPLEIQQKDGPKTSPLAR